MCGTGCVMCCRVCLALGTRQATAAYPGMVWCGVVWCGVVWCGVVWCGVVWYGRHRLTVDFFMCSSLDGFLVGTGRDTAVGTRLSGPRLHPTPHPSAGGAHERGQAGV